MIKAVIDAVADSVAEVKAKALLNAVSGTVAEVKAYTLYKTLSDIMPGTASHATKRKGPKKLVIQRAK